MARNRAIFFFEDDAGYGWSEGIYNQGADLTTTLANAVRLLPLRVRLLGTGARLTMIRVSDDEVKRDSRVYIVPPGDQANTATHSDPHDNANLCILLRLEASDPIARRSLYLRGFADKYCASGVFAPDAAFTAAFNRWKAAIKADNWALKIKTGVYPAINISGFQQVPGENFITVTTAGNHNFEQGLKVIFSGAKGPGVPRGTQQVLSVPTATSFRVSTTQMLGTPTAYGTVRRQDYALTPCTDVQVVRVSRRATGRPSSSPRGRRSARRAA